MKKVYCFYCQKDVNAFNFGKWQICPHCFHNSEDDGQGFYKVCPHCEANMPANSDYCVKCGSGHKNSGTFLSDINGFANKNSVFKRILGVFAALICFFLFLAILYVSFYVFFILVVFGLIFYLYQRIMYSRQ